jgi:hypothetical protein
MVVGMLTNKGFVNTVLSVRCAACVRHCFRSYGNVDRYVDSSWNVCVAVSAVTAVLVGTLTVHVIIL